MSTLTRTEVARLIDHSILHPTHTDAQLADGIVRARDAGCASLCVKPYYVAQCHQHLRGSGTATGTVIAFPHGGQPTFAKVAEMLAVFAAGADEVDVVVNIGKVLSGDWAFVKSDLSAMVQATRDHGRLIKVIFETCYLNDEQKIALCALCAELGVDYVKTSTGFGTGGATAADIRLMRQHSPPTVGVKASGGVKSLAQLLEMHAAGATRVGTSGTFEMLANLPA